MKVVIGSTNPAKIEAVKRAFTKMLPGEHSFVGISVASDIASQPMTDAETKLGALNRAQNARKAQPDADYWLGLEGGIEPDAHGFLSFGWVCALSAAKQGLGRSASFYLPSQIADLIKSGMDLGAADDQVFKRRGSNKEEGAVGIMTHKVIDRITAFEHATILALIPFKNPDLY